ncbi:hypothetical protein PROFUN_03223 [Planoprotostelium fungivorum]|uniref:Uncharacterized protein n=1 Tax=Planoprotostelium fungivorum TaxID=1890364 RepID=A0A2P6NX51_9EUKA|nr:hypothetical protein PROFUN_03223 [Planoprotostelium fungivorum]
MQYNFATTFFLPAKLFQERAHNVVGEDEKMYGIRNVYITRSDFWLDFATFDSPSWLRYGSDRRLLCVVLLQRQTCLIMRLILRECGRSLQGLSHITYPYVCVLEARCKSCVWIDWQILLFVESDGGSDCACCDGVFVPIEVYVSDRNRRVRAIQMDILRQCHHNDRQRHDAPIRCHFERIVIRIDDSDYMVTVPNVHQSEFHRVHNKSHVNIYHRRPA